MTQNNFDEIVATYDMKQFHVSELASAMQELGGFDRTHYDWIRNHLPTKTRPAYDFGSRSDSKYEWLRDPKDQESYRRPKFTCQRDEVLRSNKGLEVFFELYESGEILSAPYDHDKQAVLRGPWPLSNMIQPAEKDKHSLPTVHKKNLTPEFRAVAEKIAQDYQVQFGIGCAVFQFSYNDSANEVSRYYLDNYGYFFVPLLGLENFTQRAENILAAERRLALAFEKRVQQLYELSLENKKEDKK